MKTDTMYLIKALQKKTGITQYVSRKVWRAISEIITEELLRGNTFDLRGILSMSVIETKEKTAYNIKEKTNMTLPPGKKVKFKAGQTLNKLIKEENGGISE